MCERELRVGDVIVRLRNEDCYTLGSVDNVHRYDREYRLDEGPHTSFHGVECELSDGSKRSCLVASSRGPTTIREHSAVMQDSSLILAVGDSLCRLTIPALDMVWHKVLDSATCFGVHWSSRHNCLVVHGELEISRVSLDGQIAWQTAGADIFSEGFELLDDYIVAKDFNHMRYHIDLITGQSKTVG